MVCVLFGLLMYWECYDWFVCCLLLEWDWVVV